MKKRVCALIILLLNISLFAAPGGGKSRPDRGGPSGSKDRGGFSKNEKPGHPEQKNSVNDKNPPPNSKDPKEEISNNSPPETVNFRGQRVTLSDKKPEILKSTVSKKSEGTLKVTLYFNQSLKPTSLLAENIFVNNSPLDKNIRLVFNKWADCISFDIDEQFADSVEIQNVEGLNGKKVDSIKVQL